MPPRSATLVLGMIASIVLSGCVVGTRPLSLPEGDEPVVAVLSEALPHSMRGLARHSWIVSRAPGEKTFTRWEVLGSANRRPDAEPFAPQCSCGGRKTPDDADVRLHTVVRGEDVGPIVACLERETRRYNEDNDYGFWPGPNCNTYVATMARRCGIHVELPATAVGRDHRGLVGAGVTSGGTGVQAESGLVGAKIGLTEGIELHLFGGAVGVDFWPPALVVPLGSGRIGFDDR